MGEESRKPILIWGAGAIGSIIGSHLIRAGVPVVFADINAAQVAEIRAGRLNIEGPVAQFTVGAPAYLPQDLPGTYDLAFLPVRLYSTQAAMSGLVPHLAPGGIVVSCQNGLASLDVAKIVGVERTVVASFFLPATLTSPGHVTYGAKANMTIGLVDPEKGPPIAPIAQLLRHLAPDLHIADDVYRVIWTKMAYGAFLAAAVLEDGLTRKFLRDPELRPLLVALMREVVAVSKADGHPAIDRDWFQPNAFVGDHPDLQQKCVDTVLDLLKDSAKQHSGYWYQIVHLGLRSELHEQFAPMQRLAREHGIPIPVTDRLLSFIGALEDRTRETSRALMMELRETALESA